jgi:hypothetical protein
LEVDAIGPNFPVCLNGGVYSLPQGNPAGGVWSGLAVSNYEFDPLLAGLGNYWLYYSFTYTANYSVTDSINVIVDLCVGLDNSNLNILNVYPNPTKKRITISGYKKEMTVLLFDMYGRHLPVRIDESGQMSLEEIASGVYFFEIKANELDSHQFKFLKL